MFSHYRRRNVAEGGFRFMAFSGSDVSPQYNNGSPSNVPSTTEKSLLELPNEISAPYEVPQFPIEQIETKLAIQRQLTR